MTDLYKIKPLSFEPAPECERETWSAGSYVIKRYDAPEQWFVTFYGRRVDECGSLEMAFEAAQKHHLERITRYLEPVPDAAEPFRLALTPSAETKVAYWGEFKMPVTQMVEDDDGEMQEETHEAYVPWDVVKQIMAGIRAFAERGKPAAPALAQVEKADG